MRSRACVVGLFCVVTTVMVSFRVEAKPPKPAPVSNPEIVFQCEGICVANADGTAIYNVLPHGYYPKWGHLGNGTPSDPYTIVFWPGAGAIDIVDLILVNGVPTAGDVVELSTSFGLNRPELSPLDDYVVATDHSYGGIWKISVQTGIPEQLFQAEEGWRSLCATWSNDGTRIAFSLYWFQTQPSLYYASVIWVMNSDGTGAAPVTPLMVDVASALEWSPTDDRIAVQLDYAGIQILDLADLSMTPIAEGGNPSWSPDGTKLVYNYPAYGQRPKSIYVLDLVTGENNVIMRSAGSRPDWRN